MHDAPDVTTNAPTINVATTPTNIPTTHVTRRARRCRSRQTLESAPRTPRTPDG